MHTKPIKEPGARESDYWYDVKIQYCIAKYNDYYDKLTKKEFFKNFPKYCQNMSEWPYKDTEGNLKYPTEEDYDYASKHIFKKYKWDDCAESFEIAEMSEIEIKCINVRKKRKLDHTLTIMNQIDNLDDDTDRLFEEQKSEGKNHQYKIKANIESKTQLLAMSDKELGLDTTNLNVKADVDATAEFKNPLDIRMEEFQKQIREGVPRKRLEDELKDEGIL